MANKTSLTPNQLINAALTEARTDLTRMRHQKEAMAIAERRGELIEKSLVTRQAQYIILCLRAAVLAFPVKYARHAVGIADEHQAKAVLTKIAHEFLTELSNFPEKIADPNWMQSLEENGAKEKAPLQRPSSGQDIVQEQKKATRRRQQKTATMRKLRARRKIA